MVNRGEEEVWVQMNVVPRSTGNTNSGTRELTLKCKFKCYFKPMNNPLGVSPSKGKQAAPVVTTTFIDLTSAKAEACLYRQSCTRTTYLSKNYVSIGLTKHFHAMDIRSSDRGVLLFVGSLPCLTE